MTPAEPGRSAPSVPPLKWTIVVPLKALPDAKTRLVPATSDLDGHTSLVEAIRADTLSVAAKLGRVLVVLDRPAAPTPRTDSRVENAVLVQVEPGLNQGLREAAAYASRQWPDDGVVALVGDLPALRAEELAGALSRASEFPRSFVADAAGTGTTLLAARPGVSLDPSFGAGSAARHARIAVSLEAGPGLRLDVDTVLDLDQAGDLGLGPATSARLDHSPVNPHRA